MEGVGGQLHGVEAFGRLPLAFIQMMVGATAEHSRHVAPELWRRYLTLLLDGLRPARNSPTPLAHRALDPHEFDQTMS
ncbi:hypothetical protein [Nonomuraea sp. NPDC049784]|uniref:hypothetical protein n=1 Tax=Nonomuraea sp. NPDC049784 TaxID=3154361 RepID=UPI003403D2E0